MSITKNGDLPAMPTIYADMAPNGQREIYCDQTGLTKREQFAMAAMQGILAIGNKLDTRGVVAECAVKMADALLAELERTK
jgi:hypothetical protein